MKLLSLLFILCYHASFSQSISNVVGVQQGNNALVTYDLNGNANTAYFVKLYYSIDGGQTFSKELAQVTGDVKSGVRPGIAKKITWMADKEVNFLSGQVVFKVEAEPRRALPKPVSRELGIVELVSAKRDGDEIRVAFTFTYTQQNYDQTNAFLGDETRMVASDGVNYKALSGVFGGESRFSAQVNCIKGVPVKGQVAFSPEVSDLVIPALTIRIGYGWDYIFKNVPLE